MPQQYERPIEVCHNCQFITHVDGLDCYLCTAGSSTFITYNGMDSGDVRGSALNRRALETPTHDISFYNKYTLIQAIRHHPEIRNVIESKLHRHNYLTLDLDP